MEKKMDMPCLWEGCSRNETWREHNERVAKELYDKELAAHKQLIKDIYVLLADTKQLSPKLHKAKPGQKCSFNCCGRPATKQTFMTLMCNKHAKESEKRF